MRVEFHPDAVDEYKAAAHHYATRQPGLEYRFVACVESAVLQISESPLRWGVFEEDVRRFLVHVFPYAILYTVEFDHILIIAVMHLSREPGYWRHRKG